MMFSTLLSGPAVQGFENACVKAGESAANQVCNMTAVVALSLRLAHATPTPEFQGGPAQHTP